MQLKTAVQITIGAVGYTAWAVMAALDPTLRADFLRFNIAMAMGTIGLVLRDMAPSAPTDKQSGNAHVGLLALLGLSSALMLAGCGTPVPAQPGAQAISSTQPAQTIQLYLPDVCATWDVTFAAAIPLRQAGMLNKAQIDQITMLDDTVTPLCAPPMPTDQAAAAQKVAAAVTSLAILEAIHKEAK